jgi:hypothetical protein
LNAWTYELSNFLRTAIKERPSSEVYSSCGQSPFGSSARQVCVVCWRGLFQCPKQPVDELYSSTLLEGHRIRILYLSFNQFEGTDPSNYGRASLLHDFYVDSNQLTGPCQAPCRDSQILNAFHCRIILYQASCRLWSAYCLTRVAVE